MPFLSHIGELRKRLTLVIGVLMLSSVALYFLTPQIYRLVTRPVAVLLPDKAQAIGWLEPMTMRFSLSLWASLVICSPLIVWQLMAFLLPALRTNERKWALPTFGAMVVLFVSGVAFCYFMILGPSFGWLADQAGGMMVLRPTAKDMLEVVEWFLLGFGIAFQTPVIVFYLVYFGVIPYAKLRKNWRLVYVGIVIAAAMITPDFSPVSMLALAGAMIVLYELSLVAVRVMLGKRIRAQRLAEAEMEAA